MYNGVRGWGEVRLEMLSKFVVNHANVGSNLLNWQNLLSLNERSEVLTLPTPKTNYCLKTNNKGNYHGVNTWGWNLLFYLSKNPMQIYIYIYIYIYKYIWVCVCSSYTFLRKLIYNRSNDWEYCFSFLFSNRRHHLIYHYYLLFYSLSLLDYLHFFLSPRWWWCLFWLLP